jgi:hypothetical protein
MLQQTTINPYQYLAAKSAELGWPEHWKEDLTVYDKEMLEDPEFPKKFGWILRQYGTWLLDLENWVSKEMIEYYMNPKEDTTIKCFYFDGKTLKPCTLSDLWNRCDFKKMEENRKEANKKRYNAEHGIS